VLLLTVSSIKQRDSLFIAVKLQQHEKINPFPCSIYWLWLLLGGCASSGFTSPSHITNVQLSTPNFHIVETNISGQSSSKALLGLSFG